MAASVIAALFSGISFISLPSESYEFGLGYFWMLGAYPISIPIASRFFIPFYHRLGLDSVYEYMERRFDRRVRLALSGLFLLQVVFWLSMAGGFDAGIHGMQELFGLAKRWRRPPYHSLGDADMEKLADVLNGIGVLS